VIRPLSGQDAAAYRALRLEALRESPQAFLASVAETERAGLADLAERFDREQSAGENVALGAFRDGRLIGIVGVRRFEREKNRHVGLIVGMYVTPVERRQGVAHALLAEAIRRARLMPGLEKLELGVMATQAAARRLYESLGFVCWGREPRAIKIGEQAYDEDFMTLFLDATG
jgi:RimJ/RimL family protein N-acetyltransferase